MLVFLLTKRGERLQFMIMILMALSFAIFAYGAVHHPGAAFYLLPTRMWQLGAGCLLAASRGNVLFRNSARGTLAGLLLIGVVFFFPVNSSGIGYEALAVVAGACLIIQSGSNRVSALVLQNPAAVFTGKISYSLYLWHWPIIVTLRKLRDYGHLTSNVVSCLIGAGSLILFSLLSFYVIEQPFRRFRYGSLAVIGFAAAIAVFFIAVEPAILGRPYSSNYNVPSWYGLCYNVSPRRKMTPAIKAIVNSVHAPVREVLPTAYKEGGLIRRRAGADPRVVLIGDSHAVMWSKVVDDVTEKLGVTVSFWAMSGESGLMQAPSVAESGRNLTKEERLEYDVQRRILLAKWNPDIVIVANRWEHVSEAAAIPLLSFLEANVKNVIIVESPPVLRGVEDRSFYQYASFLGGAGSISIDNKHLWPRADFGDVVKVRRELVEMSLRRSNFSFLPTADLYAQTNGSIVASGRDVYYFDDDHLSAEGADLAASRFMQAIQNILSGKRGSFPLVSDHGEEAGETLRLTALPDGKQIAR
jgi:regulator of extracellular matrix RemA (YlzA/DUF370 family)